MQEQYGKKQCGQEQFKEEQRRQIIILVLISSKPLHFILAAIDTK